MPYHFSRKNDIMLKLSTRLLRNKSGAQISIQSIKSICLSLTETSVSLSYSFFSFLVSAFASREQFEEKNNKEKLTPPTLLARSLSLSSPHPAADFILRVSITRCSSPLCNSYLFLLFWGLFNDNLSSMILCCRDIVGKWRKWRGKMTRKSPEFSFVGRIFLLRIFTLKNTCKSTHLSRYFAFLHDTNLALIPKKTGIQENPRKH